MMVFPPEVRRAHKALKPSYWTFLKEARLRSLLTVPVIYSAILVFVVLDGWTTIYQWTCFPIYGIPRVSRRDYLVIDHQRLGYLNAIEKVHCIYCGYANGLVAYVAEVAARTEQYWCPIKHGRPVIAPHTRYHLFVDYGDAEGYRRDLATLRRSFSGPRLDRSPEEAQRV
jgi:hypothetical protein